MKMFALLRGMALIAALASVAAAVAAARSNLTPGSEDCGSRAREHAATTRTAPSHAARVTVGPIDEPASPTPAARPANPADIASSVTSASAGGAPRHPAIPPAAPERHSEKRQKAATSAGLRAHRPVTQRSKYGLRNTPATPGMGTLLRFGATSGREISWTDIASPTRGIDARSGRAPPRAGPLRHCWPAHLPCPPPLAALPPSASPSSSGRAPDPLPQIAIRRPARDVSVLVVAACAVFASTSAPPLSARRLRRRAARRMESSAGRSMSSWLSSGGFAT